MSSEGILTAEGVADPAREEEEEVAVDSLAPPPDPEGDRIEEVVRLLRQEAADLADFEDDPSEAWPDDAALLTEAAGLIVDLYNKAFLFAARLEAMTATAYGRHDAQLVKTKEEE